MVTRFVWRKCARAVMIQTFSFKGLKIYVLNDWPFWTSPLLGTACWGVTSKCQMQTSFGSEFQSMTWHDLRGSGKWCLILAIAGKGVGSDKYLTILFGVSNYINLTIWRQAIKGYKKIGWHDIRQDKKRPRKTWQKFIDQGNPWNLISSQYVQYELTTQWKLAKQIVINPFHHSCHAKFIS